MVNKKKMKKKMEDKRNWIKSKIELREKYIQISNKKHG